MMSFGLIKLTLTDVKGRLLESKGLMPWVTPALSGRVLHPRESLAFDFDLSDLFSIELAGRHSLQVQYGSDSTYADASMDIEIGPHAAIHP